MTRWLVSLFTGVCLLPGCGDAGPATHAVSGIITLEGEPVAEAQVGFVPSEGSSEAKPARGQTDAQGRYELQTYLGPGREAPGAMAGSYKVTITHGVQDRVVTYEDLAKQDDSFPTHYARAGSTPLSAEVAPGGENQFDFDLEQTPETR